MAELSRLARTVRAWEVEILAFHFEDRGIHTLKGVPEAWHVFAVQPT